MPTREDRTLKLVKGASAAGGAARARTVHRRTVTRRAPRTEDPLVSALARLDEEPVDAAQGAIDTAQGAIDEPVESGGSAEPPAAGDADPGAARRRRRLAFARPRLARRPVATAVLVVTLCAALAAAAVFGHRWYEDRTLDDAHQQALAAAKQTTVNFVSVSASSMDRDLQRIIAGATGEFKDQFTRGEPQVRAAIMENKVESRGSVLRAALVSGDRRSAVVLVAVDATVKNVHAPEGRVSHYRIQVDVTRDPDSGSWLVSRLQFVG